MFETLRRLRTAGRCRSNAGLANAGLAIAGVAIADLASALVLAALVVPALAAFSPLAAQTRFVFANPATYDTLDPHMIMDAARVAPRLNLYDGLLRWADNPAKMELWLAEKYSISADGRSYTFELRKGAKFHDGSEIRAADVVYSIERILALKRGAFTLLASMLAPGSTRAIGEQTVEFNLIKSTPLFLAILPEVHVVNTALVKGHEINNDWGNAWLAKNDAGSGSYKLQLYNPATGFIAERFKEHWNTKWGTKPIDEIEFRTVSETNMRVQGLITGEFHGSDGYFPPEQLKALRNASVLYVSEAASMRLFYGLLHSGREPFTDINFRKAMAYAFDYDGFNNGMLGDTVVRNSLPLPGNSWGTPKAVKGFTYNLKTAAAYLALSKAPPREITIGAIAGYPQSEKAAALFQASLEKLSIASKVVAEPLDTVMAKMRDEKQMYDVLFLWKSAIYADPNNWLGEMYDCDQLGGRNSSWYCNRDVDGFLKAAVATSVLDVRRKNYEQAAVLLMEDAAGIFINRPKWLAPFNKRVSGIRYSPVGEGQDMRWASMEP